MRSDNAYGLPTMIPIPKDIRYIGVLNQIECAQRIYSLISIFSSTPTK